MNPPERFPPDDPREWMNRARGNLARAKKREPGFYLEDLCFDAQQAAEKAIKAMFVRRVAWRSHTCMIWAFCCRCLKKLARLSQKESAELKTSHDTPRSRAIPDSPSLFPSRSTPKR